MRFSASSVHTFSLRARSQATRSARGRPFGEPGAGGNPPNALTRSAVAAFISPPNGTPSAESSPKAPPHLPPFRGFNQRKEKKEERRPPQPLPHPYPRWPSSDRNAATESERGSCPPCVGVERARTPTTTPSASHQIPTAKGVALGTVSPSPYRGEVSRRDDAG